MTLLAVLAVLAGVIGIVGSIVPGLPGPPISWFGILMVYLMGTGMSSALLYVLLAVTVAVTVADYVVPAYFTKLTGGSKYASWGAIIGLFAGMLVPAIPFGMIASSIIFAFAFELFFGGKDPVPSLKASLGAFLGFIFGTGIKIIASGVMMFYIISFLK